MVSTLVHVVDRRHNNNTVRPPKELPAWLMSSNFLPLPPTTAVVLHAHALLPQPLALEFFFHDLLCLAHRFLLLDWWGGFLGCVQGVWFLRGGGGG